jgi:hypothetical protein
MVARDSTDSTSPQLRPLLESSHAELLQLGRHYEVRGLWAFG